MGTFNYNLGIPAANNNPSDDQQLMQTNTDSISQWALVDHRGFNDVDVLGGYHTNVHLVSQGAAPASIPAGLTPLLVGQLLNLEVTTDSTTPDTDTQLFHITSNGGISQLTGDAAQTEGYQWLGGTLVQWGQVSSSLNNTNGTVTFKGRNATTNTIPFPNSVFNVILTPTFNSNVTTPTGQATLVVDTFTLSNLQFDWIAISGSSSYNGFFWVAIGN